MNGLHANLSNADYHGGPGLSHSGAKRLRASPFHYQAARQFDGPPKPSPQMVNGTLVHCALLEPREFDRRYVIGPDVHKASKEWKLFAAECAARGLEIISEAQALAAHLQADALRRLPEVAELLAHGMPEVSAYWTDEETGVLCKCRPDWVSRQPDAPACVLLDVKTAADASPSGFAKAVANFGYHHQADWYSDGYAQASGVRVEGFVFAVVESEHPYAAAVYMLSDRALLIARESNRAVRRLFAQCEAADQWPGYAPGVTVLDLPAWAERDAA